MRLPGATSLVLQTVLLPPALAAGGSRLCVTGGTHVPWSPCFHYLDRHWRVLMARLGVTFDLEMVMAMPADSRLARAANAPNGWPTWPWPNC